MKRLVCCFSLLFFTLWHSIGNAYDPYNYVHVTYSFDAKLPLLNGYRHHFQDGLVLSQKKTWIANYFGFPCINVLEADVGEAKGSLLLKQSHAVWYRSRVYRQDYPNGLDYLTQFSISLTKKVYPDFKNKKNDYQLISAKVCNTEVHLSALWWLFKNAQISNFNIAPLEGASLKVCGVLKQDVNWGEANVSQILENTFENARDEYINFNFVSTNGLHAQSNPDFSYQLGLENGKTEKVKRREFPVFDASGKNLGACSLYIKETKSDIAIYSLFTNYDKTAGKTEGGLCYVGKANAEKNIAGVVNENIRGIGDVASGVVISFNDEKSVPREITDVVIALSPPTVIPAIPFQPANYVESDNIHDKFYSVACLNYGSDQIIHSGHPYSKETLFWEEYDAPGIYTNGALHFPYNGAGHLSIDKARKDMGQPFCKLPNKFIKSSQLRDRGLYYDVTCIDDVGTTFSQDRKNRAWYTNGKEEFHARYDFSLEEFNKKVGEPYCKFIINDPYHSPFPSTYIKSDSISDKTYKVLCWNDPNSGDTTFWEVTNSPSTYTNGVTNFIYQGKAGWNIEQARKDIGQPFCKSSPPNYVKSSERGSQIKSGPTTMWLTYDVTCVNDVKSSFISDLMDPTIDPPDYTNYSNGSETFWSVNSFAGLEELNNVIGQPFCKSKVNKENH